MPVLVSWKSFMAVTDRTTASRARRDQRRHMNAFGRPAQNVRTPVQMTEDERPICPQTLAGHPRRLPVVERRRLRFVVTSRGPRRKLVDRLVRTVRGLIGQSRGVWLRQAALQL